MLPLRQNGLVAARTLTSRYRAVYPRYGLFSGILQHRRWFRKSSRVLAIQPYLLADIGEGITECQIISWTVKPGDKVDQFDPICEVQSDKASVEITSRFEGTIENLHYQEGETAKVGSALLDIDVLSNSDGATEISESVLAEENPTEVTASIGLDFQADNLPNSLSSAVSKPPRNHNGHGSSTGSGIHAPIAPAVRRILRENNLSVGDVQGTGKDGRVLKEDVLRRLKDHSNAFSKRPQSTEIATDCVRVEDRRVVLSPIQSQMFKSMTSSLAIPHFLYTHSVNLTSLSRLRQQFEALSLAIHKFPMINSVLDAGNLDSGQRPELVIKGSHNFGIAVDTPNGLLVPVIHDVQNRSILGLAAEIARLAKLAREEKLTTDDMKGGTLVVSNIGSIGGNAVAPVILSPMTAIVAVGKSEDVPAFETDQEGNDIIVKKKQVVLSWSADHRVLDGATVARCAQQVAMWLEKPDAMCVALR